MQVAAFGGPALLLLDTANSSDDDCVATFFRLRATLPGLGCGVGARFEEGLAKYCGSRPPRSLACGLVYAHTSVLDARKSMLIPSRDTSHSVSSCVCFAEHHWTYGLCHRLFTLHLLNLALRVLRCADQLEAIGADSILIFAIQNTRM